MPCESFCLKPSIFWENCIKLTFLGCPWKFYHRFMYIHVGPSSGRALLNLILPFKLILRRFEVVFWCLKWECCTFWKIDGNSFKFTNTILHGLNTARQSCWPSWAKIILYSVHGNTKRSTETLTPRSLWALLKEAQKHLPRGHSGHY